MKKMLLITLVLLTTMLTACDLIDDADKKPTGCAPGFELVDGACEEIEDPVCSDDEILVNGKCEEKNDEVVDLIGPDYQSQGYDNYSGRDIVSNDCSHLDNIGEWQPVWCDEFDYTGLPDSSLWNYDVGGHGWGNGESQYYTNGDIDNAFVEDGFLTIRAIKEYYSGSEYTSTRLISKDKGDWLYGKIQVRAKVPTGRGTWPAIWMLPTDWEYGGWPTSGEIDIMEYVGYDPNVLHATIHTGAFNHMKNTQIGKSRTLNTIEEEFHVYEIEWEPNVIRYYLNGSEFFKVEFDPDTSYTVLPHEAWPFDKDFHLLLNTAIGGAWGGAQGIDDSIFPVDFQIDYVRVYQKDYSGMDTANPDKVMNVRLLNSSQTDAYVAWDIATDDVLVEKYEVYLDDTLVDTVTHNAIILDGLTGSTNYTVKVIAVDFAGNKSEAASYSFMTDQPQTVNDRVEAEDYSSMSGIQLEATTDTGGGMNVGWIDTDDYMDYELVVTESGNYTLTTRVASQSGAAGGFEILKDGTSLVIVDNVPSTGGWQSWSDVTSSSFYLEAGTYTFRFKAIGSGFNVNYFEFNKQ